MELFSELRWLASQLLLICYILIHSCPLFVLNMLFMQTATRHRLKLVQTLPIHGNIFPSNMLGLRQLGSSAAKKQMKNKNSKDNKSKRNKQTKQTVVQQPLDRKKQFANWLDESEKRQKQQKNHHKSDTAGSSSDGGRSMNRNYNRTYDKREQNTVH